MAAAHDLFATRFEAATPRGYWALALVVGSAFVLWLALLGRPDFPLDDAYITLHNAQVLRDGVDPNYGVSPLVGATSSVHLLLVAALAHFVAMPWAGAVATWVGIALYLSGILVVARRCAFTSLEAGALIVVGVCAGMSTYHLLNGLETGLAMAAVLWALILAAGPPARLLPALLGVMPFIRPELALLAVPLLARQVWLRWRLGASAAILGDLAVFALGAAPWLLWIWSETGSIVPQTAAAKRAFFAHDALPWSVKVIYVVRILWEQACQLGPLVLGLYMLRCAPAGRIAQLFIVAVLVLFGLEMPVGLRHNEYRYLYTLVPLLIVGLAYTRAGGGKSTLLTAAMIATAVYAIAMTPLHVTRYLEAIAFTRTEHEGLVTWIRHNLPDDACIAVHDSGYLAFVTDRPLVDVVGLKTPTSRIQHELFTAPSAGADRGVALARIIADTGCGYLVVLRAWDETFAITESMGKAGVELTPLRIDGEYRIYRVR